MISAKIVPAIIPKSASELREFAAAMSIAPELHVDVVDGKFVPFTSWPYEPADAPVSFYDVLAPFSLEVDLMVSSPLSAAKDWLKVGADRLVFHVETISPESLAAFILTTNVTIGISANNSTPFSILESYFPYVDYVQVMGIAEIGSQGQPFDESAITRINEVRAAAPHLALGLDGSVNRETLPRLATLKLDRYIMGSAITKAADKVAAFKNFCEMVS